jgi:hypothetical protein
MNQTPDELWLAFDALAKTYPHDDGVRLSAHLARWLVEEHQRMEAPIPTGLHRVVKVLEKAVAPPNSPPGRQPSVTSD